MSHKPSGSSQKSGRGRTILYGALGAALGSTLSSVSSPWGLGFWLGLVLGIVFDRLGVERARGDSLLHSHEELSSRVTHLEQAAANTAPAAAAQPTDESVAPVSATPSGVTTKAAPPATAVPATAPGALAPGTASRAPRGSRPHPAKPMTPPTPNVVERGVTAIRGWLFGGNTVARVGILVLLVGVTLLARWAAENSLFPIEARLAGGALIGLALTAVGFHVRRSRPGFGTTLQGGGVAALYLISFMSYQLYELIPVGFAFGLFVVIAIASGVLSVLQNALPLIVIGSLGGFLAPILASTGSGNHVALFSYYLVLNLAVAGIAFKRSWRILNLLAFVCTYGVATAWGVLTYEPEQLASTLPFVVLFLFLFTGEALLFASRQPPNLKGITDGTLVFGTPLVTLLALAKLLGPVEMGLAIATAAIALLYAGIAFRLWRTAPDTLRQLAESFIVLAVGFATMAIPFAFEDSPTTTIAWALEGAGVYWIGVRQKRRIARVTGLILQPLAAASLVIWASNHGQAPEQWIANGRFLSSLALAFAGLAIAREAERENGILSNQGWMIAQAVGVWGLAWWGFGAFSEFVDFLPERATASAGIGLIAVSALMLHTGARALAWESGRVMTLIAIPLATFSIMLVLASQSSLFAEGGFVAWPLCIAAIYWILNQLEDSPYPWTSLAYAPWLWLCGIVGAVALHGIADDTLKLGEDWELAGVGLGLGGTAAASLRAIQKEYGAFGRFARVHFAQAVGPLLLVAILWAFGTNFAGEGATRPLPYLPLINPVDLTIGLIAISASVWLIRLPVIDSTQRLAGYRDAIRGIAATLAFCWLNAVIARGVVQWGGVAHDAEALWDSSILHVCLSITWTLVGLAGMWLSTRRGLREPWMVFACLLGVTVIKLFIVDLSQLTTPAKIGTFLVVGLLLLVVGYLSPVPPDARSDSVEARAEDEDEGR